MRRLIAILLCAALACATGPAAALAQSDSGEIHIQVTDAATKQPLGLARVLLDGAVITSELTSQNGEVIFTDVPDGIYRARIVKRGYAPLTSASFEVLDGRIVTVAFALVEQTSGLKVIGSVSVKASATISSTSIDQNSPQRRLSDDLAGALNKLSGVSIQTSSDDSDATQTISLEGHDASQTQLTLDGIPLNAPGSAGNLAGYATDLFTGASVHAGQTLGAAGGSVNFTTLQPTLSWLSAANASLGSYGKYNYGFAETGSIDKLGLALQSVYRVTPSLVDGFPPYEDASGLFYTHQGDSEISGNLLKLRYEFGDTQTVTGTFLSSARNTDIVCLRYYGPPALPCGYGPNNYNDGNTQLYSVTDNALLGATQIQASLYSSTTGSLLDQIDRYVDGVAQPIGDSALSQTRGFTFNATLPAQERHTISIQAYGTSSSQATTPLVPQAAPYYNGSQQTGYSALQATDTIHSNDKLALFISAGASDATGSNGATAIGSAGATWRPTKVDTFSGSYSLGGVAATAGRGQILSDPASLRFDCTGNVAYGNAPGQQPAASSSNEVRVGYTRTTKTAQLSLTAYHQVQNGVLLPILVNGTVIDALGELPFGYLSQAGYYYSSLAGCNTGPDRPLLPQQIYFTTPVNGVQRTYEGGSLTGYVMLGGLVIQPYYDVNVSKASSSSPFFENPYAVTIAGNQLPNVPVQKAGIVFDYKAPHSILEWLADAQYVARNNPNNLPAYTTFDAGVSAAFATGSLTLAASNLGNAYAGIFSGPANAVPYTTLGGYTVATTARPLTPRSVSATYIVRFGQAAVAAPSGPAFNLPRGATRAGASGGGPGGGGGGGRGFFSPLPNAPPADPFAVVNGNACTAENAATAQRLSTELKAYVAAIEAAKTPAGYPATFAPPAMTDAVVTYHAVNFGKSYALAITPRATANLRAFAGCLSLHVARADDVTQRGLYAPASAAFFVAQVLFAPQVGLYIVARRQQAGQEQFRVYALPSAPPKDPFAVHASPACTGDENNVATQALAQLAAYFTAGTKPANWIVTPHVAKSGTWYELEPGDPTVIGAIVGCGRVAAPAAADLEQRGYDGLPVPALNYAPALGLYLIRPVRPRPSPLP
jgi:hypothetical protein